MPWPCHDPSLLAAAAAGDEFALRRVINEHHDDMRRVALSIARDRAIAEEATQRAWVIAWKRIGDVRDETRLRPCPWLGMDIAPDGSVWVHAWEEDDREDPFAGSGHLFVITAVAMAVTE